MSETKQVQDFSVACHRKHLLKCVIHTHILIIKYMMLLTKKPECK